MQGRGREGRQTIGRKEGIKSRTRNEDGVASEEDVGSRVHRQISTGSVCGSETAVGV